MQAKVVSAFKWYKLYEQAIEFDSEKNFLSHFGIHFCFSRVKQNVLFLHINLKIFKVPANKMEGSEIILSLDYAVDDELKDDGHDVCDFY